MCTHTYIIQAVVSHSYIIMLTCKQLLHATNDSASSNMHFTINVNDFVHVHPFAILLRDYTHHCLMQRPPVTSGAPSSVLGGATGSMLPLPQSLLLQQQALAALAAQQVQMGSHLGQPTSLSSSTGLASTLPAAASANAPGIGGSTDLKGQQGQGVSGSGLASGQPDYKPFPPT